MAKSSNEIIESSVQRKINLLSSQVQFQLLLNDLMCRVFLWPTRRRSPKEDYMHHRDVELKAIRLQSTKERRDTSYPRRGTPLKEPIRECASVQSMVLSVLSVLNKIFGCMRTSQSKYYSRTLNNRPLIRNNTYKTFFIDKLRVRGVSRK